MVAKCRGILKQQNVLILQRMYPLTGGLGMSL